MAHTDAIARLALLAVVATASACADEWPAIYEDHDHDGDPFFTETEWEDIETLAGVPVVPPDPTNAVADDPLAARFGKKLFFDRDVAGNGHSCADCHRPDQAWVRPASQEDTAFNTTSVLNISVFETHTWVGKRDTLWGLVLTPTEGAYMESSRLRVARRIAEEYRDAYHCVFGNQEDAIFFDRYEEFPEDGKPDQDAFGTLDEAEQRAINRIFANYGKAVAAYMRRLNGASTRFDDYVLEDADDPAGPWSALSDDEKDGLRLFVGGRGNCIACHNTNRFTDNEFHDIAVPRIGHEESRYEGLAALQKWTFRRDSDLSDAVTAIEIPEPTQSDRGRYRTPSLRNVAATAPYMHNGIYGSLEEVIDHYDNPPEGDGDLDVRLWQDALPEFSPEEVGHLVQFLETLSAEPPAGDAWSAPPHAGFQICNDPGFEIGP